MSNLFTHGTFVSHSGLTLPDKVNCDALTDADWEANAKWFAARLSFKTVIGIPSGGLKLAKALSAYTSLKYSDAEVLICDDVLTTGASMQNMKMKHPDAIGAVLFSRKRNIPHWITARWTEAPRPTR